MSFSSQKKPPFNPLPANGLASQSTQQPRPVCTWSAHGPHSFPSPLPFPRSGHTLTATATPTGETFLFGGWVHARASSDLYAFSTRDFSTTLLQTSGEVPAPRARHGTALIGTTLLIFGGKMESFDQHRLNHDSVYLLNLVSREWTRVVVNGPGPNGCLYHTTTMVGSKLFVFGGKIGGKVINDVWALDLSRLKSQPLWESYEPIPGNEKPLPRADHVSVTTEDRIIVFGGTCNQHCYNETWSFDISTRKWTELQCTGSIPSPRGGHAAVLVDDVMYVFGGFSMDGDYLDDLYALQLSTQRWFEFHNVGPSPRRRSHHSMASDGTRVFVLGGYSKGAGSYEISLIHLFDTKDIKYPEPERNAVNLNQTTTPIADRFASRQITHERNPGPNERPLELTGVNSKLRRVPEVDGGEGSTEYHASPRTLPSKEALKKMSANVPGHKRTEPIPVASTLAPPRTSRAAPHSSSEEKVTRSELEQQLSVSLAAQTERDHRIAQLTDELALKSALLEQAEANAVGAARRAEPELREHADDRRPMRTSLVKQKDVELVDMQARLGDMQVKLDELLLSRDQQIEQFANVRTKLEAKESELDAVRLRLTDAEKGLAQRKAEADTLHARIAAGSVNRDEDQVTRRFMERARALEAEMVSKRWNEKSIEEMECRNEGGAANF